MAPALEPQIRERLPFQQAFFVGLLVLICYAPAIKSLVGDWLSNDDMGHGFFVPIIAGYIVWQQKDTLLATTARPNWWGLPIVLLGAAQCLLATLGVELFLSRSALILTVAGSVWLLGGTAILKKVAFPLFLLCFMIPLPAVIFNALTFPLQLLASQLAEGALSVLGVPVLRHGNVLELPNQTLSVVEACSGIRSLLSLTFLSLVYGYFFEQSGRMRLTLFLATVPIAILANAGRVTITGVLSLVNPALAQGFFHESTGWIIFMIALGILLAFHWAMRRGMRILRARA